MAWSISGMTRADPESDYEIVVDSLFDFLTLLALNVRCNVPVGRRSYFHPTKTMNEPKMMACPMSLGDKLLALALVTLCGGSLLALHLGQR